MQITTRKAAEILGITMTRVQQFARAGRLPPARIVGNVLLFEESEVSRFAAKVRKCGRPRKTACNIPMQR
ncbi:MAG: helix-turn-helix domain-containing protein [Candidatus Omnitrophica bacterium]|nr:helix-turn-helix domain-containing protein [Candidatus Omnitrophota bacterium]MDE2232451.1 helix-turn-helix domain-containing protein [Candidatus Omnitrophota bacterium]